MFFFLRAHQGGQRKGQRVRLPHPNGPQGSRHRFSMKGPDVAGRRKGSRHTVPDKTPNLPPRSPEENSAHPPQTGQVAPHPLWPPTTRLTAHRPTPPSQRTRVEGRRGFQFPNPGPARTPLSNPKGPLGGGTWGTHRSAGGSAGAAANEAQLQNAATTSPTMSRPGLVLQAPLAQREGD